MDTFKILEEELINKPPSISAPLEHFRQCVVCIRLWASHLLCGTIKYIPSF